MAGDPWGVAGEIAGPLGAMARGTHVRAESEAKALSGDEALEVDLLGEDERGPRERGVVGEQRRDTECRDPPVKSSEVRAEGSRTARTAIQSPNGAAATAVSSGRTVAPIASASPASAAQLGRSVSCSRAKA